MIVTEKTEKGKENLLSRNGSVFYPKIIERIEAMGEDRYDSLYAPWNPSGQKTRLSLLQRMNEEQVDEQTWRDFFRKYSPFIIMMGNCMGLSRDEIKELRSRIFLEISQKGLGAYDREKGTFRSWFKALVKFMQ